MELLVLVTLKVSFFTCADSCLANDKNFEKKKKRIKYEDDEKLTKTNLVMMGNEFIMKLIW